MDGNGAAPDARNKKHVLKYSALMLLELETLDESFEKGRNHNYVLSCSTISTENTIHLPRRLPSRITILHNTKSE